MGGLDAPHDRALDLGAQLAEHLGRIGVLPQVFHVAGKATFARQQRRRVRDGAPTVRVVLAVQGEVHALSSSAPGWVDDLELVTNDARLPALLAEHGATLIGYRALRDAMRAG